MKNSIIVIALLIAGITKSYCAEPITPHNDTTHPYQITFIPPLGTNGYLSHTTTNFFSLNILAGYNGGLDGMEIGGIANVLAHDAKGIQVSGMVNAVRGDLEGVQAAGFANLVGGTADGIMVSGFVNATRKSAQSIQVAGFANHTSGTLSGAQLSGFSNSVTDSVMGLQAAGFANYSGNTSEAIQIAGFTNLTKGNLEGVQISGFLNAAEDVNGMQVSGFLNKAKVVNGTQIGFINVADSFSSGYPIGFISSVKNGYNSFQLGVNEMQFVQMSYKSGVPQFHNIFYLGIAPLPETSGWSFGYGVGSRVVNGTRSGLAVELSAHHINEGQIWTNALNVLTRLNANYELDLGKRFGLWAGPSLNLMISSNRTGVGEPFNSEVAPYTILSERTAYDQYRFWVGAQAGLKF